MPPFLHRFNYVCQCALCTLPAALARTNAGGISLSALERPNEIHPLPQSPWRQQACGQCVCMCDYVAVSAMSINRSCITGGGDVEGAVLGFCSAIIWIALGVH